MAHPDAEFFQLDAAGLARLSVQWHALTARYGASTALSHALLADLLRRYGGRGRHYHTPGHVQALLDWCTQFENELAAPDAVRFAIWYHDAVYVARRHDNESRSAALAEEALGKLPAPWLAQVHAMILATQQHQAAGLAADGRWFLDFDLAILGSAPPVYAAYRRAIRREYRWVPGALYRRGRRQVLESFLQREHLYFTAAMRARLEAQARANLASEIAELG